MSSLEDIIDLPANLEVKRALAVKMILFDFKTEDICALLNVSDAFVSKWKIRFENEGAEALKLNYKGGTGFLTDDQRDEILFHLRMQSHYSVEELRDYIEYHYGVVYHSKQSYYDLLQAAGLTFLCLSSGYEAWRITHGDLEFICMGGGKVVKISNGKTSEPGAPANRR